MALDAPGFDFGKSGLSKKERELIRRTYQTLERVTSDFETRWHFNSAIALIMELINDIYSEEPLDDGVRPEVRKEVLEMVTLMLAPMTPHIAEEMWEMLGHPDGLWNAKWPYLGLDRVDLAKDDEVEIPVQVNGKLRGKLNVPIGITEDQIMKLALAQTAIAQHVDGKRIVKVVYVPNRLLNLVVS